jgi:hypothetical protein
MARHYAMLRHGFSLRSAVYEITEKLDELSDQATGHEQGQKDETYMMAMVLAGAALHYLHMAAVPPERRDRKAVRDYQRMRLEARSAHLKKAD